MRAVSYGEMGKLGALDVLIQKNINNLKKISMTYLNAVEIFYKFKGYNEAATYIKNLTDPFYFEYKIDMLRFMDKPEIALEVIISDKNVENLTDFVKEIIAKKPKLLRKAKELADKNKVILNLD